MSFYREQVVKRFTRSKGWRKVRKAHIKAHPLCASCGSHRKLEVHHIKDFSVYSELELEPTNLITLCRAGSQCHLTFGHLANWKSINPLVVKDAAWFREKVKGRRTA